MRKLDGLGRRILAPAALAAAMTAGCGNINWNPLQPQAPAPGAGQDVPPPINLLLPKEVRIHPFTGTRTFDEAGGVKGIEVRIEALDAYGDATKAFGDFRFELYAHRPNNLNPKGRLIATWPESLLEPRKNLLHWDNITRTYVFKLQWYEPIPVGQRFVLAAVFSSPFTGRLFAERVFISGQ